MTRCTYWSPPRAPRRRCATSLQCTGAAVAATFRFQDTSFSTEVAVAVGRPLPPRVSARVAVHEEPSTPGPPVLPWPPLTCRASRAQASVRSHRRRRFVTVPHADSRYISLQIQCLVKGRREGGANNTRNRLPGVIKTGFPWTAIEASVAKVRCWIAGGTEAGVNRRHHCGNENNILLIDRVLMRFLSARNGLVMTARPDGPLRRPCTAWSPRWTDYIFNDNADFNPARAVVTRKPIYIFKLLSVGEKIK